MSKDKIAILQEWIDSHSRIVFFGGAGVSTESGIPDFRSVDGLYHQQYAYPPETILSHSFYLARPDVFYDFYRNKMLILDAKPNMAHKKLAELEEAGKLTAVVTQNIDGLHQAAGSKTVMELHGSVLRNYCEDCNKFFDVNYVKNSKGVPVCDKCGGLDDGRGQPLRQLVAGGAQHDIDALEGGLGSFLHGERLIAKGQLQARAACAG